MSGPTTRLSLRCLAALVAFSCGGPLSTPATPPPRPSSTTPTGESPPPPKPPTVSIDSGTSTMVSGVQALGIDLSNPGELGAIDRTRKIKLMQFFIKALGTTCEGCHVPGDPKADTHNKQMARAMWKNFLGDLRDPSGGPIFCDTCHQGHEKILARDDDKVLAKWMKANYVEKFTRADKTEHACATCHGKPFDTDIFKNRFKITL